MSAKKTFILVVVDVEGALATGSLMSNVYLVDNNQYIGSWQQGTSDLHTVCQDGHVIIWRAQAVDAGTDAIITGFAGVMVSGGTCQPQEDMMESDHSWSGRVETHGIVGSFIYRVNVSLGGRLMWFEATLKVV